MKLNEKLKKLKSNKQGVTLLELIIVVFVMGILAIIIIPNVTNVVGQAKTASLQQTISELQSASDQFYAQDGAYPTFSGSTIANQPSTTTDAELNTAAVDGNNTTFLPGYVRSAPTSSAASAGLTPNSQGATGESNSVYYGVTASGTVFATLIAPTSNAWTISSVGTDRAWDTQYASNTNSTTISALQ